MEYAKTLIDEETGEEYPYNESFENESYFYEISVQYGDKDGELNILKAGSHIEFDDGSWLDFDIAPERLFPQKDKLEESDLLKIMNFLFENIDKATLLSKKEMDAIYNKYLKSLKS